MSLELLGVVAQAAATSPLMIVCTLRSPGLPATAALTELSARLAASGLQEISLASLPPDQARLLLNRQLQHALAETWTEEAVARADGNPFFLVELARLFDQRSASPVAERAGLGVPATVLAVLRDRLGSLNLSTRRLLDVSAVVGRQAPFGLLERVSGLPAGDLDAALAEAVSAGFVTEQLLPTPRICFTHALVQEALYEEMRPVVRARLHAAIGTELATGHYGAPADELAVHLLQGAEVAGPAAALPALLEASRHAAAQMALEHVERLLRQALVLTSRLPPGSDRDGWEPAVQARLGSTVAVRLGWGAPEANSALQRAQHLALRAEPDAEMFAALYHRISWLTVSGSLDTALTLSDILMERSTAPGVVGQRYELLGRMTRGAVNWFRGADDEAVPELVRANELAALLGPGLVEAFREHPQTPVLGFLSQALAGSGRVGEGWAMSQRGLVLARESHPAEAGGAVMFAALLAAGCGDHDAAVSLADELSGLAEASGLTLRAHTADIIRSWSEATSPRTPAPHAETALTTMRNAIDSYRATGAQMITPIVLTLLGEAELAHGNVDRSRDAVQEAQRAGERGAPGLWRRRLGQLAQHLPPPDLRRPGNGLTPRVPG